MSKNYASSGNGLNASPWDNVFGKSFAIGEKPPRILRHIDVETE
jgi:hypothetical protein